MGLGLNPSKTTLVTFSRKRKLERIRPIHLNGITIKQEKEVKYLGLTLDSKLLWKQHAENVVNKATRALMICRNLAGKSWGCKPDILTWMYTMIVRPSITYGAIAWGKRTQLKTAKKSLSKLQRLACVCITGAMRTCPTAAIEIILGLTPLHLVIERIAKEALIRLEKAVEENG